MIEGVVADMDLKNPNIFQFETGLGILGSDAAVSIRCPHCRHLSQFPMLGQGCVFQKRVQSGAMRKFKATLRSCPNVACNGVVFVVQETSGIVVSVLPPELIDFSTESLPDRLALTLSEAIACHAAGAYRAAALMVRRLLEELCEENKALGKNLHDRITALKTQILIPEALYDAMWELKALGNDAAHVHAKDYDQIGRDESADSIELAKEILKAVYQHKSLVARLSARKKGVITQVTP